VLVHDNDDDPHQNDPDAAYWARGCSGNGNNCPQPWDNHGADGMNMMFADGHAEFVRRVNNNSGLNIVISRILARSQKPWEYFN
jgi:prepilin-type processing-associated H-X9-DG protein